MKTTLLAILFMFGALSMGHGTAFAQTDAKTCLNLGSNIRYGMSEFRTDGDISRLQDFLATNGFFDRANMGTMRFGRLTLAAVIKFQSAHGIPATGFVGPLTRAAISSASCGTQPVGNVSLYSITPSAGAVGRAVNITGFGFTNNNTILMDGSVAARNVPIASSIAIACTTSSSCHGGINQTISLTIPGSLSPNCPVGSMCPMYMRQVTPGTYKVTVVNDNGTSNELSLTVTSGSSGDLTISGLDAPSSLALSQTGTWTVHTLAGGGAGNLHYAVTWGDENIVSGNALKSAELSTVSTSASFSHGYQKLGTYTQTFTVSDDNGHSVTTSSTVTVSPYY